VEIHKAGEIKYLIFVEEETLFEGFRIVNPLLFFLDHFDRRSVLITNKQNNTNYDESNVKVKRKAINNLASSSQGGARISMSRYCVFAPAANDRVGVWKNVKML
jgi:hypothetical protein